MKFREIADRAEHGLGRENILFSNVENQPFRVVGVYMGDDGRYHRMPHDAAKEISGAVGSLSCNTAGGRIRFVTDSTFVAVKVKLGAYWHMYHFPACGNYGLDVYDGCEYVGTVRPGPDRPTQIEGLVELGAGVHTVTVNMPLYSDVREVLVGLDENAEISHAPAYKYEKPVVFYGSSITQGGCASRPGACYQNILCRALDFNYLNLGFSGAAKAEDGMIKYISELDMSVFVFDYDHNAPTDEHLAATHEKMFLAVRAAHPTLPIIIMSRPSADVPERVKIIRRTFDNAVARGDRNVYLVPGVNINIKGGTVDGCHPNDLGFYYMAESLEPVLKKCLEDSAG